MLAGLLTKICVCRYHCNFQCIAGYCGTRTEQTRYVVGIRHGHFASDFSSPNVRTLVYRGSCFYKKLLMQYIGHDCQTMYIRPVQTVQRGYIVFVIYVVLVPFFLAIFFSRSAGSSA